MILHESKLWSDHFGVVVFIFRVSLAFVVSMSLRFLNCVFFSCRKSPFPAKVKNMIWWSVKMHVKRLNLYDLTYIVIQYKSNMGEVTN